MDFCGALARCAMGLGATNAPSAQVVSERRRGWWSTGEAADNIVGSQAGAWS